MTNEIDTEIASKMLSALITDTPKGDSMRPTCSLEEQKRYLKKYADTVSVDDRRELARLLAHAGYRAVLKPCSEGTIINLDTLNAPEIELLYMRLDHMRNNKHSQKYLKY